MAPDQLVSAARAAEMLGVSASTIRNWTKAGYLIQRPNGPALTYKKSDILTLQNNLLSGRLSKLQSRSNRSFDKSLPSISTGYIQDKELVASASAILRNFQPQSYDEVSCILFLAALNILQARGEMSGEINAHSLKKMAKFEWKRRCIKEEMTEWLHDFGYDTLLRLPGEFFNIEFDRLKLGASDTDDILGFLYQALTREGEKSISGAYYTPTDLVRSSLAWIKSQNEVISGYLDPCCGSGQFLLRAIPLLGLPPERIFGFDKDPIAVKVARLNILISNTKMTEKPHIYRHDFLHDNLDFTFYDQISAIATNPPWGAIKTTQISHNLSLEVSSGETFSLFIAQALKKAPAGTFLSFILPESILNIKMHSDIRTIILANSKIEHIHLLGKPFPNVFTNVIRLDLVKTNTDIGSNHSVKINNGSSIHSIRQNYFQNDEIKSFNTIIRDNDLDLFRHLFERSEGDLKGKVEWAMGIVTGNNKRFLSSQKKDGMEEILKGSDIFHYSHAAPCNYIRFDRENLQQVAKDKYIRAPEKLIYRFISKNLVFAYDNQMMLTLNSANILIPTKKLGFSLKALLAILNSNICQFIYLLKYPTLKVLKGNVESLPLPEITEKCDHTLSVLAGQAIDGDKKSISLINEGLYSLYDLNSCQIDHVRNTILRYS